MSISTVKYDHYVSKSMSIIEIKPSISVSYRLFCYDTHAV